MAVVGIDLGTTSSRVALCRDDTPFIIENAEGEGTTPSFIAITPNGERLVGEAARRYAVHDPKNVAFAVKRLIGRKWDDPVVQEIRSYVPYEIVAAENGDAWVRLAGELFSPIQLSAFVLQKLKRDAEAFLQSPVTQAVITVPAYFNDVQRQATRDAGTIAGLEVLRVINEPTAAALAYGLGKECGTIVVYDLGGGTFDVSVMEIGDGVYEVLSARGDMHLGGEDFDYRIVARLASEFRRIHGIDLLKNERTLQRLKHAAEQAKIELSARTESVIDLPFVCFRDERPLHLKYTLTRTEFELLVSELVDRSLSVCREALAAAGYTPHGVPSQRAKAYGVKDIQDVVLVGGSTRIPCVGESVARQLKRKPHGGLRREDAVALGAAIQAAVLKGDVKDVLLMDALPMALGVEVQGGRFFPVISADTAIPTKKSYVFTADGKFPETWLHDYCQLYNLAEKRAEFKKDPATSLRT